MNEKTSKFLKRLSRLMVPTVVGQPETEATAKRRAFYKGVKKHWKTLNPRQRTEYRRRMLEKMP